MVRNAVKVVVDIDRLEASIVLIRKARAPFISFNDDYTSCQSWFDAVIDHVCLAHIEREFDWRVCIGFIHRTSWNLIAFSSDIRAAFSISSLEHHCLQFALTKGEEDWKVITQLLWAALGDVEREQGIITINSTSRIIISNALLEVSN